MCAPAILTPGLWQDGSFDVVVLWSVLEHLRNPLEALVTGLLVSEDPEGLSSSRYRLFTVWSRECGFREYWALLDLPRHLSFFGRECLSDLCEQAGMKLIVFKTPFARNCVVLFRKCL